MADKDPNTGLEVRLRHCTRSDVPELARMLSDAFMDDPMYDITQPGHRKHPEQYYRGMLSEIHMCFVSPGVQIIIAENPKTGEMMGSSIWSVENHKDLEGAWACNTSIMHHIERTLLQIESRYTEIFLNDTVDTKAISSLRAENRSNFTFLASRVELMLTLTAPKYQGMGVGKKVLDWGLDAAEAAGLPATVESSVVGERFYKRNGFTTIKRVVLKSRQDDSTVSLPVMIYESSQCRGRWLQYDGNEAKLKDV